MTCTQSTDNTVAVAITRGDTMRLRVTLTDADDAPVDVTGWSWQCQLRIDPDDDALVTIMVEVVDGVGGRLELSLAPDLTAALPVRDFVWDLEARDGNDDVRTVLTGQLRVREDVSR